MKVLVELDLRGINCLTREDFEYIDGERYLILDQAHIRQSRCEWDDGFYSFKFIWFNLFKSH